MYQHLDSKSQLKISNTQLERKGHCPNSSSYEKNSISIYPEITLHQQQDAAAKKLTSR